jgi:hypothetical protein
MSRDYLGCHEKVDQVFSFLIFNESSMKLPKRNMKAELLALFILLGVASSLDNRPAVSTSRTSVSTPRQQLEKFAK